MRVLFITSHKYLPQMRGGLQTSTHELCRELIHKGHHVSVLAGLMPGGFFELAARIKMKVNQVAAHCKVARYRALGYPVWLSWEPPRAVSWVAARERPDIIVVLAYQTVTMALEAKKTGIPILMQLQDVEFHQHGGRFQDLGVSIPCTANSNFTADKYREAFGVNPCVILPFINRARYETATTRECVLFINPHPKKGLDIALGAARLCPNIPFLFVESWPLSPDELANLQSKLETAPNVTFLRAQDDVRSLYSRARLLLAPSIWEEAFGRVASEAHFSGIPVIASTRGGLPEAVGPGGILLDPCAPITEWAAAVAKLWNDTSYYDRLSQAALTHAQRDGLQREKQIRAWLQLLASVARGQNASDSAHLNAS